MSVVVIGDLLVRGCVMNQITKEHNNFRISTPSVRKERELDK
jgi:hypothetical protein